MNNTPAARIIPPAFLHEGAPAAVLAALPGARAVGGCVRDALAGRAVHDVDVAAPMPPGEIASRLRTAGLKVFETGLQHGTVTAVLGRQPVEVTSLRRDVATDGRHAVVEWTTDWQEDAARRDFTINAMSLDAEGALFDYFGGREDLAAGRVRFVGDAATRLAEDYLRALRFFRFWARYGEGAPDAAAMAAIRAAVPGLARLSAERIWMELKRLLEAPDPRAALALMAEAGVLGAVLPEAVPAAREAPVLAGLLRAGAPVAPLLRLAALLPPGGGATKLATRLKLANAEAALLGALLGAPPLPAAPDDAALRRLLARHGAELLRDWAWLAEARGEAGDWPAFRARAAATPRPTFPVQGRDLLALGLPPGPAIGALLRAAEAAWLDAGCTGTREDWLAWLRDRAASPAG